MNYVVNTTVTQNFDSRISKRNSTPAVDVVNAVSALSNNSKSAVMTDGHISDVFEVPTSVLQGDALIAPFLFIILVDPHEKSHSRC